MIFNLLAGARFILGVIGDECEIFTCSVYYIFAIFTSTAFLFSVVI